MTPIKPIKMRRAAALALGALLCGGAGGQAMAGVETLTFGGDGQNGPCSAGYNAAGAGGVFASLYGSCAYSVSNGGTVATGDQSYSQGTQSTDNKFSGTLDAPGKPIGSATSSFDRSNVTISDTNFRAVGDGYAAANLADGTVHASASANTSGVDYANALESDTLHFKVAGANAATVTAVIAQFTLDGKYTPGNLVGSQASLEWQTGIGSSGLQISYVNSGNILQLYNISHSGDISIIKNTAGLVIYDAIIQIDGAAADVPFAQNLYLGAGEGWTLNYENTGSVKLILPPDVTYTSDSGVFLTAPAGVPEPATWATMLVGFAGLGATMRRSRRQRINTAVSA